MNTDSVRLYWPGSSFPFRHGGQQYTISNGEFHAPRPLAQRLLSRYCGNGMVALPPEGAPASDGVVSAAADERGEAAHRIAGQNRTGEPTHTSGRGRGQVVGRGAPGTEIPEARQALQERDQAKREAADKLKADRKAAAEKKHAERLEKARVKQQSRTLRGGKAAGGTAAVKPVGVPKPEQLEKVDDPTAKPEGDGGEKAEAALEGAGNPADTAEVTGAVGEAPASTPDATPGAPPPEA